MRAPIYYHWYLHITWYAWLHLLPTCLPQHYLSPPQCLLMALSLLSTAPFICHCILMVATWKKFCSLCLIHNNACSTQANLSTFQPMTRCPFLAFPASVLPQLPAPPVPHFWDSSLVYLSFASSEHPALSTPHIRAYLIWCKCTRTGSSLVSGLCRAWCSVYWQPFTLLCQ